MPGRLGTHDTIESLTTRLEVVLDELEANLNLALEIPRGTVQGFSSKNVFGDSSNLDSGIDTDIHDGANPTDDVDIWLPPTTARTHQIVSSSTSDDGAPVGVGARTIRVTGLTAWTTDEVEEDIIMNGTTDVPTVNTYVIINELEVLTHGATNINVGVITATADTDGTVTAQINAGEGGTHMAIYGIPSTKAFYVTSVFGTIDKSGGSAGSVDMSFLINDDPDVELLRYHIHAILGATTTGSSHFQHMFNPYLREVGPAIIKMQGNASGANFTASAGFDLIIETL